jgi:tetratricopeptide (TPR) repeat protein
MTKRIALFLFLAVSAILTVSAFAQNLTVVKGLCKDETGKPYVGYTVEINNLDTGFKTSLKTNNRGEYYSMGVAAGNYKITLLGPDGKVIYFLNGVPLQLGKDNEYDVDMAKERAAQAKASGVTEEQRKEYEKAKKENEKIKGVNGLLAQARQQKKEGNFDGAVATMEQAIAQDTTHDVVYAQLATAYFDNKKYSEAEAAYAKAIEIAPATSKSLGIYHSGLALTLAREGKADPGLAECAKTAQIDPAQAGECYYNMGAILTNQGKADDANASFDKAIAADPARAEAYYQKGVNLLSKATISKDGKMVPVPGTVEALNKYLELSPDGRNAQAAKDLLASLGTSVQTTFGTQKKSGKK